jgi:hypothetical protein
MSCTDCKCIILHVYFSYLMYVFRTPCFVSYCMYISRTPCIFLVLYVHVSYITYISPYFMYTYRTPCVWFVRYVRVCVPWICVPQHEYGSYVLYISRIPCLFCYAKCIGHVLHTYIWYCMHMSCTSCICYVHDAYAIYTMLMSCTALRVSYCIHMPRTPCIWPQIQHLIGNTNCISILN